MEGTNHHTEISGDAVRFQVRPRMAVLFFAWEFALLAVPIMLLVIPPLETLELDNPLNAHAFAVGLILATLFAAPLLMLLPSNWHRRRYAFTITPAAVEIDPPKPSDGIHWGAMFGGLFKPAAKVIPRASIREVVVRNAIAGSFTHNLALSGLQAPNAAYVGVGAGGIASAVGMATAEQAAAGIRRLFYAIGTGPRLARSYYVVLRAGAAEHVIGGGLDAQGASDLANDTLHILSTLPATSAA